MAVLARKRDKEQATGSNVKHTGADSSAMAKVSATTAVVPSISTSSSSAKKDAESSTTAPPSSASAGNQDSINYYYGDNGGSGNNGSGAVAIAPNSSSPRNSTSSSIGERSAMSSLTTSSSSSSTSTASAVRSAAFKRATRGYGEGLATVPAEFQVGALVDFTDSSLLLICFCTFGCRIFLYEFLILITNYVISPCFLLLFIHFAAYMHLSRTTLSFTRRSARTRAACNTTINAGRATPSSCSLPSRKTAPFCNLPRKTFK